MQSFVFICKRQSFVLEALDWILPVCSLPHLHPPRSEPAGPPHRWALSDVWRDLCLKDAEWMKIFVCECDRGRIRKERFAAVWCLSVQLLKRTTSQPYLEIIILCRAAQPELIYKTHLFQKRYKTSPWHFNSKLQRKISWLATLCVDFFFFTCWSLLPVLISCLRLFLRNPSKVILRIKNISEMWKSADCIVLDQRWSGISLM